MKNIQESAMRLVVGALLFCASSFVVAQAGPAADTAQNGIENLQVNQSAGQTVLRVTMRKPLSAPPANFSVANPARIVFDFPATENALGRTVQQVNEGDLRSLNIVQVSDRTRLVLNLAQSATFETRVEGNVFSVLLQPKVATDPQNAAPAVVRFAEARPAQGMLQSIRDINFRRGQNGEGRIVVDLSDPNVGIDIRQQGATLIVDFGKTQLPENLRRRLDVTDFATPVTSVNTLTQGDATRMIITPRGLWEHNAYQSENQFVIEVKQVVEDPNKLVQGSRGGYQGEKLSLNFQNVEVRAVLQVISDFTNLNVVVSDSVSGALTLRLKDVPWDQALDIILNTRGLDMRKNGNVIWIAPRDELAAKEKLSLESKQQISELEPTRTESFQLNYHKAKAIFDFLKTKDQTLLSKRGSAIVDERSNKLFVSDIPAKLDEIRGLIKEIDVPVRQVMIEARIVEATDNFAKNLGVRLGYHDMVPAAASGRNRIQSRVGGSLADTGFHTGQSATDPVFPTDSNSVNLPAAGIAGAPAGQFSLILFNQAATRFLNLELTALESDGNGKIVSSPRVLTADQIEALIEQGTELPYQQATSSGATSVSFRKANLALKVKPQITPDGRVIMALDITKDSPNTSISQNFGIAIDTKHVKTDVLVDNGGTVVIGGIYTQDKSEVTSKVPLFGDIPYVGALFRNKGEKNNRTELLIFITPRIIGDSLKL